MKKILLSVFALMTLASCQKDADMNVMERPNNPANTNASVKADDTFIDAKEAVKIAKKFVDAQELFGPATKSSTVKFDMAATDLGDAPATKASSKSPAYYIYNLNGKGYVIVSAHKAANPILGYSLKGKFDPSKEAPEGLVSVLKGFSADINKARELNLKPNAKTAVARAEFLTPGAVTKGDYPAIKPLLGDIQWNQSPHYNALCARRDVPVGCVATAAAQIMRYWKYPDSSQGGTHSYRGKFRTESFNFDRSWDWSKMPAQPLRSPNAEMAAFNYAVAVSVNMGFDTGRNGGSGAYTSDVPGSMKKYFKYSKNMTYKSRKYYSYQKWAKMLHDELSAGRPIEYCGHGDGGGHAFVCDGYHSNGYFHFNWGWAGSSDGYFLLNALNPGSLGVGGGNGGFNQGQGAVIGFAPPAEWINARNNGGNDNGGNRRVNPDNGRNRGTESPKKYCESNGKTSRYTYISKVKFGNKEFSSGASYKGYEDHTNDPIEVNRGQRVKFYFTPGFYYYTYDMSWRLWVDTNKDGKFDRNELIGSTQGSSVVNGHLSLPSSLAKGKYRVRVSAKQGGYASPCESFDFGEVEDFTLDVK